MMVIMAPYVKPTGVLVFRKRELGADKESLPKNLRRKTSNGFAPDGASKIKKDSAGETPRVPAPLSDDERIKGDGGRHIDRTSDSIRGKSRTSNRPLISQARAVSR